MPKPTAGAIIYRRQHGKYQVLLTRRNIEPFKDYWCLPGGHIEKFENAYDAIIREVKEETNLELNPNFLCYMDEIFQEKNIHNVVLMFCGEATNTPKADPKEVSDIQWFSIDEALKLNLAFKHNEAIEFFIRAKKF